MKTTSFSLLPIIFFACWSLLSCARSNQVDTETLTLLIKEGVVEDLTMVNGEFVEIQLNESVLERTHLNKDFDTKEYIPWISNPHNLSKTFMPLWKSPFLPKNNFPMLLPTGLACGHSSEAGWSCLPYQQL